MRNVLLFSALVLMTGCSSLSTLKKEDPAANNFSSSLASEYLSFAEAEKEQGQKGQSEYFAKKGLAASKNQAVMPEDVADDQKELASARKALLVVNNNDNQHVMAQPLARAQVMFDCWAVKTGKVAMQAQLCRDEFQAELKKLQKANAVYKHIP